ncbi:HCCA isomerase/glutathione S-transferase kappa [Neurospora crassa]|uniref:Glutathione S-transferase kappa n=2 Tax=Neurospora crassa TaxID=5141 RepID=F5HD81_NEUCR|nr:2-hydroxychromene-2-carboxylate isomerase [Neurospora crassa OR74A]EAA26768.2 2-hydroxychromene-2-carboxylate isomerase [Neurospora crassa OR74A]KHE78758.1 HCCA isomerase/glutathione S-transferase kappa [Neurospora crassa]CAD21511.1 related to glutahione s-transferase subunit 13.01 [Neurospora crassa]|eukprot:XP_956004.2 2-hydroxychromene-2-carboxylate isomerase [Neurospora crassa OR74A]
MVPKPKITLYLDTVSPFAYEAYHILRNDPIFKNVDIKYVPIFLGGLMNKCSNTPPIKIKNKDKWINVERLRWAHAFSVPIVTDMPPNFPPNTLPVQRVLAGIEASSSQSQSAVIAALDALYKAFWALGQPIYEPAQLRSVLASSLGGEEAADKVLGAAQTAEVKQRLVENTDKAFAEGAFGLPWFTCTNTKGETEGFWGVDHLGQVVQFLALDKEASGNGGWKSVL